MKDFLSDLEAINDNDQTYLHDKLTSLSVPGFDPEEILLDYISGCFTLGPSSDNEGRLFFDLQGHSHSCGQFWDFFTDLMIKAGANYIFAVSDDSGSGHTSVEALKGKKLETVYLTGWIGESDHLIFDRPEDTPFLDHVKKLYEEGKLVIPVRETDQDKLIDMINDRDRDPWDENFQHALDACEDINQPDSRGKAPLIEAIKMGDAGLVRYMSEQGRPYLNSLVKDHSGLHALEIAEKLGNEDIINELIENLRAFPSSEDEVDNDLFVDLCLKGDAEEISVILGERKYTHRNVDKKAGNGELPLTAAIKSGSTETVYLVCTQDPAPHLKNSKGESAFDLTKSCNNNEIVELIDRKSQIAIP